MNDRGTRPVIFVRCLLLFRKTVSEAKSFDIWTYLRWNRTQAWTRAGGEGGDWQKIRVGRPIRTLVSSTAWFYVSYVTYFIIGRWTKFDVSILTVITVIPNVISDFFPPMQSTIIQYRITDKKSYKKNLELIFCQHVRNPVLEMRLKSWSHATSWIKTRNSTTASDFNQI